MLHARLTAHKAAPMGSARQDIGSAPQPHCSAAPLLLLPFSLTQEHILSRQSRQRTAKWVFIASTNPKQHDTAGGCQQRQSHAFPIFQEHRGNRKVRFHVA